MVPHNPSEVIAIVDENDKVIDAATRKEVHEKGLLHREVCAYVISKGKILLQKRVDNEHWDHSCGGHFSASESYEQGVIRELQEELGLKVKKEELVFLAKEKLSQSYGKRDLNTRFVTIFLLKKDLDYKDFSIDKEEVKEIKFFSPEEVLNATPIERSSKLFLEKYLTKKV